MSYTHSLGKELSQYEQAIPNTLFLLRSCLGRRITRVVWHHMEGDDGWGRLLETSELQFESTSIYFRTPHSETTSRGVNQMNEIVALWPPAEQGTISRGDSHH